MLDERAASSHPTFTSIFGGEDLMGGCKRVLIAEEGVKDFSGHWSAYSASIADGLSALGCEAVVAGNVAADQEVRNAMPFHPVFHHSRWDGLYEHRPWLERKALVALHNRRLYRDIARFLETSEKFDVVFCGNILVYHSFGWWRLIRRYLGVKFDRVVLMLVQPAGTKDDSSGRYRFPFRSGLFAWSLRQASDYGAGRVSLAVETPAARDEFSALVRRPIELMHHPVDAPAGWRPQASPKTSQVRLVCPGFARFEKGSDILLAAIRLLSTKLSPEQVSFVLQWKPEESFHATGGEIIIRDEGLARAGWINYLEDPLGGTAYWDMLASADLIVLPYRCDPYTTRLSRVTIEAMISGRPIIYPRNSWLEFAVTETGSGMSFDDGSPESLAETLLQAINQLAALQRNARHSVAQASEHYSSRRFAERLLALKAS